jgi:hypothetical protein
MKCNTGGNYQKHPKGYSKSKQKKADAALTAALISTIFGRIGGFNPHGMMR